MRRTVMRRYRRHGTAQTRGLTLLELIIAVAVLSIGTLAALRVADQSRVAIGGATPRLLAQIVAQNRAEELRLSASYAAGLPNRVTMGGRDFAVSVVRVPTSGGMIQATITARADTGEGALVVAILPAGGAIR